jgi:hypothetical protein
MNRRRVEPLKEKCAEIIQIFVETGCIRLSGARTTIQDTTWQKNPDPTGFGSTALMMISIQTTHQCLVVSLGYLLHFSVRMLSSHSSGPIVITPLL